MDIMRNLVIAIAASIIFFSLLISIVSPTSDAILCPYFTLKYLFLDMFIYDCWSFQVPKSFIAKIKNQLIGR